LALIGGLTALYQWIYNKKLYYGIVVAFIFYIKYSYILFIRNDLNDDYLHIVVAYSGSIICDLIALMWENKWVREHTKDGNIL
jgi:hypothetical protein